MTPQIDNQIDSTTTTVTLPSYTYKLNVTGEDKQEAPIQLEYLESTGTQSILIDSAINSTVEIELEFALTDLTQTSNNVVIGHAEFAPTARSN